MRERTFKLSKEKTDVLKDEFTSQMELARAVGIKQARFNHYVRGIREIPESLLTKLCDVTKRKPSDFLDHPAEKIIADASFSA